MTPEEREKYQPYLKPPPLTEGDYVLGQQFFTEYNAIFLITTDAVELGWAQNVTRSTLGPTMQLIILE